jgi:mannosyltransferase OCH1-like enzyme
MIPKTIHYCWFGLGKLPPLACKCIASWRNFLPEYEIVEWNERTFNVQSNRYVREAYQNRKYAFVSDFVRLYALYHHGGIYMDTDVEVLQPLDKFLIHEAFSGFESPQHVPTGIMASVKGQRFIGELLSAYEDRNFVNSDGTLDYITNTLVITNSALRHGLKPNGAEQEVNGMMFYPPEYFCPYDVDTGVKAISSNTYCIHWFAKSYVQPHLRLRSSLTRPFHRLFGKDCFVWLKKLLHESS